MWPKNGKERKDVQDVGGIMDLRNVIVVHSQSAANVGGISVAFGGCAVMKREKFSK